MSRRRVPRVVLGLVAVACACGPGRASAARPLVPVQPRHLNVTFGLPPGWHVTKTVTGDRLDAVSADGTAHLALATGTNAGSFADFVASETAAARAYYKSVDPKARLTTQTVELPSGRALEIDVLLVHGAPVAIVLFDLQHGGVTYHFTYFTSQSAAAAERPGFERSARSITFSR